MLVVGAVVRFQVDATAPVIVALPEAVFGETVIVMNELAAKMVELAVASTAKV
jgi:hypothetical protein